MLEDLTDLANKFGTDKGTKVGKAHGYTALYDKLFRARRNDAVRLLEIGLSIRRPEEQSYTAARTVHQVPSVNLWLAYFPNGHVTGLDIADCSDFQTDRFSFYQADCGDRNALRAFAQSSKPFDFIVDDGSHASFHQQLALTELFPALASGGIYIIEDLHWQPEEYEELLPSVPKTADFLPWLFRQSELRDDGPIQYDRWADVHNGIASIVAYRGTDIAEMIPPHQRKPGPGFFKRRRMARRSKRASHKTPIKLIVLTKK